MICIVWSEDVMTSKILGVEDDFANQQVAVLFLKKFGYDTDVAENGAVAVEMAQKEKYPLIYMDCQMPKMDGFAATKQIRNSEGPNKTTPIIALTANAVVGIHEECLSCGMNDVLNKPINMQSLEDITKQWIEK